MYRRTKPKKLCFLLGAARVIEALERHPELTTAQIAEATSVSVRTAHEYVNYLNRGAARKIYVCRYIRNDSGRPTPVWKKGSHRNAMKPRPYHRKRPVVVESVEG